MTHINFKLYVPPAEILPRYKELKSVTGETVGYKCIHCGRLFEAPHKENCTVVRQAQEPQEKTK